VVQEVEDGVAGSRVVGAHVFVVGLRDVARPYVQGVVRALLHRARAGPLPVAGAVGLPVEEGRQRRVGDHLNHVADRTC
jgi:hypothetical protein